MSPHPTNSAPGSAAHAPEFDLERLRPLGGDRQYGFEEFTSQLAHIAPEVSVGCRFVRVHGAGGDGGVEAYWEASNGEQWGFQAKFIKSIDKQQLTNSVRAALAIHPTLSRYTVCVPFELTGTTARGGKSQKDRWDDCVTAWNALVRKKKHRAVAFEVWPRSELLRRLIAGDPHGGVRRFWFDINRFDAVWFRQRVEEASRDAGPRYNPKMTVRVPLAQTLDAFGTTPSWRGGQRKRLRDLDVQIRHLTRRVEHRGKDPTDAGGAQIKAAYDATLVLREQLAGLWLEGALPLMAARRAADAAISTLRKCREMMRDEVEKAHGAGSAENAALRQFEAEYMLRFPTEDYDLCKRLLILLEPIQSDLASPAMAALERRVLLVTGVAGSGKTHSMCDAAVQGLENGQLSVVILGEKIGAGDVLDQIRTLLGLPGTIGHDELLGALDAAAQVTGAPLMFFFDGLNEREPRDAWKHDLAGLVARFKRYPHLRLVLTCRTTYLDAVIEDGLDLPRYEHAGFAGVEFEAAFEFFAFWNLDRPAIPMLQPEFANPLFLRLLCSGLAQSQRRALEQPPSLREAIALFISALEQKAAAELDLDARDNYVQRAVARLLDEMRTAKALRLSWEVASAKLEDLLPGRPRSKSMRDFLLREGLLTAVRTQAGQTPGEFVRFGFERLGEYLYVERALREIGPRDTAPSGEEICVALGTTPTRLETIERGLLEALALLAPEHFHAELSDLGLAIDKQIVTEALARSLAWRAPETITSHTVALVHAAFSTASFPIVFGEVLGLVGRRGHPLGATFVDRVLRSVSQPERDVVFCGFLHLDFEANGPARRLSRWALRDDLGPLARESATDWAKALLWFCLAADRRVRDHATMGVVNLMQRAPDGLPELLTWAATINDEYVVERVLLAAYGALVRSRADAVVAECARVVWSQIFEPGPPSNALIRDHARSIIEFASLRGAFPMDVDISRCRPPHASQLPPELLRATPSRIAQGGYGGRDGLVEDAEEILPGEGPALHRARSSVIGDDFSVYTMSSALDARNRDMLDFDAAKLWVLHEVRRLGLTERMDNYDGATIYKYGSGRGKPDWAERIGKKYQWIALYRLIGIVADNITARDDPWAKPLPPTLAPQLQAPGERNLDPTLLMKVKLEEAVTSWWVPIRPDFAPDETNVQWLNDLAFPDSEKLVEVTDPAGIQWLALHTYANWDDRIDNTDWDTRFRTCFMQVRSYLIDARKVNGFWTWLQNRSFEGRTAVPEGASWFPYTFAGEYPWSVTARRHLALVEIERDQFQFPITPTAHDQSLEFGFDSYHDETFHLLLPHARLLDGTGLEWNGRGGYATAEGATVIQSPELIAPGQRALLVRRDWLESYLKARRLAIVWTVLSELQPHDPDLDRMRADGYSVHSRAHMLRGSVVLASAGVTLRKVIAQRTRMRPGRSRPTETP
jgi:hypothetical protein